MAIGDLVANLTANTGGWSRGLSSATSGLAQFASGAVAELGKTTRAWVDGSAKQSRAAATAARYAAQINSAASRQAVAESRLQQSQVRALAESNRATARAAQTRLQAEVAASRAAMAAQRQENQLKLESIRLQRQMARNDIGSGVGGGLAKFGLAMGGIAAIVSGLKSIVSAGAGLIGLAADVEQTAISFEVMLGSADKADAMISQMRQFAASTPLETKDIQDAGRTLLQFGVDGNNIMPMLRMLGDVSGGNADRFSRLSLAFGQVSAAGRLQGQDLLQMVNSGFNPLKVISEQTGKSMADLKAQMEAGGISTQMVVSAFQAATGAGGQFAGMMDRQSKTTSGLFSTLKDNVSLALLDIGRALIDGFNLNGLMADTSAFLDMFRGQWLPGIVQGITTLGGSFGMLYQSIREGWGRWIGETIGLAVEFFANWDLYLAIAWESVALFGANTVERFRTMFVNAGELLTWFSGNWQDVLFTIGDYAMTVFINIGQNLRDIWSGVLDFIAGRGFSFDPTPLTEGFKSAISEMPQLTAAAIQETTPALEGLYATLAERQAAMAQKIIDAGNPSEIVSEGMSEFDSSAKTGGKKKPKTLSAAAEFGSKDALSIIANASSRNKDPVEKNTATIAKESTKQTGFLRQLVDRISEREEMGIVELPA